MSRVAAIEWYECTRCSFGTTLTVGSESGGRLKIDGVVNDHPGVGNELAFHLEGLDQSFLPPIIESLLEVEGAYPVRSSPDA